MPFREGSSSPTSSSAALNRRKAIASSNVVSSKSIRGMMIRRNFSVVYATPLPTEPIPIISISSPSESASSNCAPRSVFVNNTVSSSAPGASSCQRCSSSIAIRLPSSGRCRAISAFSAAFRRCHAYGRSQRWRSRPNKISSITVGSFFSSSIGTTRCLKNSGSLRARNQCTSWHACSARKSSFASSSSSGHFISGWNEAIRGFVTIADRNACASSRVVNARHSASITFSISATASSFNTAARRVPT